MKTTEQQRGWVVSQFACYMRSAHVRRDFLAKFGFEITRQQADKLNLQGLRSEEEAKKAGQSKWWPLYKETRDRFNADVSDVAIASKSYRIKMLDAMFDQAYESKNYHRAAGLLEQAAKETGGAFTSKKDVTAHLTGKIEVEHDTPAEVRDTILASRMREAIAVALAETAAAAPARTIQ